MIELVSSVICQAHREIRALFRPVLRAAPVMLVSVLPSLGGSAAVAAPSDSVEIVRDHSGVPHVYASDDRALFFGAGYALAHDRMAQWELTKRMARGELAEILGAKYVEADRLARAEDHTDAEWESLVQKLSETHKAQFFGYRAGINQYISEASRDPDRKLPFEFKEWGISARPWSVADCAAAISKALGLFATGGGGHELANLEFRQFLQGKHSASDASTIFDDVLPRSDDDAVPIIPASTAHAGKLASATRARVSSVRLPRLFANLDAVNKAWREVIGQSRGASRSILVGPSRSASGRVLMLQSTADGPDIHLAGAGFDTAGWAVPGTPFPVMGRGTNFGWLVTTGESDIVDIFEENLRPGHPFEYDFNGKWRKMTVRSERIKVKGEQDRNFQVARTVHGPVILSVDSANRAYSKATVLWNHELDDVSAWLELGHARTFAEFETAVSHMVGSFNVQYGGEDGTIAHWHTGTEPIRAADVDPRLPTLGDGKHEWRGRLVFADWPKLKNPPSGYLHVWNNKPMSSTQYGDGARYGATFRTYLANRLLAQDSHVTIDALKEINRKVGESGAGADLSFTSPSFFAPALKAAVASDKRLTEAVDRMSQWNGLYEPDSSGKFYADVGLTIYRHWIEVAQRQIVGPVIGDWWHKIDDDRYIKYRTELLYRIVNRSAVHTQVHYHWLTDANRNETIRQTVETTVLDLEKTFGTSDMTQWRQPVFYKFYDARAVETTHFPRFSDEHPEGSTAGGLGLQPAYVRDNGSEEWNGMMEISAETRGFWDASPTGGQNQFIDLAGHGNAHIADQVFLHVNFQFKHMPMTRADVDAEAEDHLTLQTPATTP